LVLILAKPISNTNLLVEFQPAGIFFILMNTQLSTMQNLPAGKPHFFLTAEPAGNGLFALHLNAVNLPKDFLGVAFHLPISGEGWSFEGMQLEGDWALHEKDLFTLTSFKNSETDELIFGLSSQGGKEFLGETLKDGRMATFFLKIGSGDYTAQFSNTVFSVQVNGGRVDVSDVFFEGAHFSSGTGKNEKNVSFSLMSGDFNGSGLKGLPTQELLTSQETDFSEVQPGFSKVLGANIMAQNSYETVYKVYQVTFFFIVILVLGAGLAYICHRLLQRKR
jgi:hypothetical protein